MGRSVVCLASCPLVCTGLPAQVCLSPVQGEQESNLTHLPVELWSWGAECYAVCPMIVVSLEAGLGCVSLNTASTL